MMLQAYTICIYIYSHSPFPPDEKPSHDSPHGPVAHPAFYNGHGTIKNPLFATRCPMGHPLPLEPLVSLSVPAHSHSPSPPDEQPSHDSPHGPVAHPAFYNGHGTIKNPLFATRCPLGHPLPPEPVICISASAPSPSPPENALLLRRSRS